MGSTFSCGRCTASEMTWARFTTMLLKIIKLRRLWHVLGMHLQQYANLRPRCVRDKQ